MSDSNPYARYLGDRDPIDAMRETTDRIETITAGWAAPAFERPWEPGKWTARQILIHLAQCELAMGHRARMGVTEPNYQAQSFDQDRWLEKESTMGARDAVNAFLAISRMNRAWAASLSAADRALPLTHPAYGPVTVEWVLVAIAGHQINHLKQLELLA